MSKRLILLSLLFIQSISAISDIVPVLSSLVDGRPNRYFMEGQLPLAEQTHEIIGTTDPSVVLISQMSNSVLLKTKVMDGVVQQVRGFQIGSKTSWLHGLANSNVFPGQVWITLQKDNLLLRIDPKVGSIDEVPVIIQQIAVPKGFGPHCISEYGNNLWVSLQDSSAVLRINHADTSDYTHYPALPRPIFVALHPENNMFYSSEDNSAAIMQIDANSGKISQLNTNQGGITPVGLISGPKGIWFTLLGSPTQGTGTIGHIDASNTITYHKLTSFWGKNAGLLHLAFDEYDKTSNTLWVLSSSIINPNGLDMLIKVTFDAGWTTIVKDETVAIPTQNMKAHRILVTPTHVYVTELTASRLFSIKKPL
ncbi:hypothetical protein BGZ65_006427 [Modicella reniformis]|uniref:Uncharacterized protein n=1 Tax=Modicella reniformis TaxID=1440133 RepID=A0A9P6M8C4_9FUNG|nr:hypothetical protein BGZ65_006427 [Modicella reniformis]